MLGEFIRRCKAVIALREPRAPALTFRIVEMSNSL
jgi:hypothetical protein